MTQPPMYIDLEIAPVTATGEMAPAFVGPAGPQGAPGADGTAAAAALAATLGNAATKDVGTTAGTVAAGDDARLTDARPPTGGAGGVLSGNYPNPGFAVDMATQAELEAAVALRIAATEKGAANGVATLGADSKIPEAQLPAIAITDVSVVASQAAMLALTAEKGDVAVRSDINKTFALAASPASTLANWIELRTPTDAVLSVAGRTGVVTLTKADVGLGSVDNVSAANLRDRTTHTGAQAISTVTGLQAALDDNNLIAWIGV